MWVTIDPKSIEVDDREHDGPHHWLKRKHWPTWCAKCGLVFLKNEVTQRAIKLGCGYKRNPVYVEFWKRYWASRRNT